MKKCFLLLTLTTLLFSCTDDVIDTSSDANTDPTEDTVLVKRTVYTYLDGEIFIGNYNYDGNRLLNITDENGIISQKFTYENDFLTRIDYYRDNETAYTTLSYDATNNSIDITEVYYINSPEKNFTVFYNDNGTITVEQYYNNEIISSELITIDSNGNVIKMEDSISGYINIFTYDTKNNAFKYIHQIEIFNLLSVFTENGGGVDGNQNNLTSWTETYQGDSLSGTWEYTYNSDDYPTNATYFFDGIEDATLEYFYE